MPRHFGAGWRAPKGWKIHSEDTSELGRFERVEKFFDSRQTFVDLLVNHL